MNASGEKIDFLIEHGLSFQDIQGYIKSGISLDDLYQAARDMVERGEPIPPPSSREPEEAAGGLQPLSVTTAQELQAAKLPPVQFLVDGILPCGTGLLTAASKIGKSWLVLDLGLCLAAGSPFMGYPVIPCGVLYLALEDSLHRLQNRMNQILDGRPAPERFYFAKAGHH